MANGRKGAVTTGEGNDGREPARRARFARSLARPLWALVRKMARPLAWRTRTFLLAATQQELAGLRAGQERISAAQESLAAAQQRLAAAQEGLAAAQERLAAAQERLAASLEAVAAESGGIAATLESALLTLALPVCSAGAPSAGGAEEADQAA